MDINKTNIKTLCSPYDLNCIRSLKGDEAIKYTAEQFETILTRELFKEAFKFPTTQKWADIYQDIGLDILTQNFSLGLGDYLYNAIKKYNQINNQK